MRVPRSIVLLVALLMSGSLITACGGSRSSDLEELGDVIELLQADFIDQDLVSDEELTQAAIDGILDYLDDPYTSYLDPQQYDDFSDELSGRETEFEGIGAEVTIRGGQLMILGPLPGSPAAEAGLLPGDIVLEVDGESIEGLDLLEAVGMIRGTKGTEVVLRIVHTGEVQPIEVGVVRDTISVSSVSHRVQAEGIGYIRLDGFDASSAESVRDAIEQLRAAGVRGLVLDMRNNGGGLVDAAVEVTSEFVESGLVFRWLNADGTEREFAVTGEGTAYDLPLVVIVNGFSASASEIVAGSLKDHGRATLVGTRTFGKGSVNLLSQLESGAGLYVTAARWLTPNGNVIEGLGIDPDIIVGNGIDVQAAQRIGPLTQSLCRAFDDEGNELRGQGELTGALQALCGLRTQQPPLPDADEPLDVAMAELRKLMEG